MLPKKNRADKKAVEKVFKGGKFLNSPNFTLKFLFESALAPRISVIVPKSVAKAAVKRNLLRRRGYTALKRYINALPNNILGVLVFKKQVDSVLDIENELKNIFNKVN